MKPIEVDCVADWMSENVVLVGLIAHLSGLDDAEYLLSHVRVLHNLGREITAQIQRT